MDVAPHPHIGLQTVSWLLEGEVLHRDTLGNENLVRPGELNLMTSGGGIAHTEETPRSNGGRLRGLQLWVALPDGVRNGSASFEHHPRLPDVEVPGATATLIAGELAGMRSPASVHSPLVGADVRLEPRSLAVFPLDQGFEHALFVLEGLVTVDGQLLRPDVLYYLGLHRHELRLASQEGARLLLLGGAPFAEPVLMWWNFVARTHEEIVAARTRWMEGSSFGRVPGYDGPPIPAPPLHGRAAPNPAS